MKKYTVVTKVNGDFKELVYYAENTKDIKALEGFVAISKTERVKHPSPEIMQRAIIGLGGDLVKFYNLCDKIAEAITEENATE